MFSTMSNQKDLELRILALRNFKKTKANKKEIYSIKSISGLNDSDFEWFKSELSYIGTRKKMNMEGIQICELCGLKRHYGDEENLMKCDEFGNVLCENCFAGKPYGVLNEVKG